MVQVKIQFGTRYFSIWNVAFLKKATFQIAQIAKLRMLKFRKRVMILSREGGDDYGENNNNRTNPFI